MDSDPKVDHKVFQGLPKHFVWVTDKCPWAKRVKRNEKRGGRVKSLRQAMKDVDS